MSVSPSTISDLPNELLLEIFSYLSTKDLCLGAQLVCSRWSRLCSSNVLWKDSLFCAAPHMSPDYVLSVLEHAPKLKRFVCYTLSFQILYKLVECCKDLEILMCKFKGINGRTEKFAKILRHCTKLKTLQIPHEVLANAQLAALVGQLTDLRAISLTEPLAGPLEPVELKDISDGCPSLEFLDLCDSPWRYSDFKYFLEQKRQNLAYLSINHESVEGTYVYPLLTICVNVLHTLELRDNSTDSDPLPFRILSPITALSRLKSLTIDISVTGDTLVQIFGKGQMSQLLELELHSCCEVNAASINVISSNCPNLSMLAFYNSDYVTDAALKGLYRCTNLQKLLLQDCQSLTDVVMDHIARCTNLKSLKIVCCKSIKKGLRRVLDLSELRELELWFYDVAELPLNIFHLYLNKLKKVTLKKCTNIDSQALALVKAQMPYLRVLIV